TFGEQVAETPLRTLSVAQLGVDACLAMRLSRGHARRAGDDGEPALVHCDLCGGRGGAVARAALRPQGRLLGAVLVSSEKPLGASGRARLHDAVAQTAPVLGLQRAVETAERRAGSDPLTTLANR